MFEEQPSSPLSSLKVYANDDSVQCCGCIHTKWWKLVSFTLIIGNLSMFIVWIALIQTYYTFNSSQCTSPGWLVNVLFTYSASECCDCPPSPPLPPFFPPPPSIPPYYPPFSPPSTPLTEQCVAASCGTGHPAEQCAKTFPNGATYCHTDDSFTRELVNYSYCGSTDHKYHCGYRCDGELHCLRGAPNCYYPCCIPSPTATSPRTPWTCIPRALVGQ